MTGHNGGSPSVLPPPVAMDRIALAVCLRIAHGRPAVGPGEFVPVSAACASSGSIPPRRASTDVPARGFKISTLKTRQILKIFPPELSLSPYSIDSQLD
jgi:hypothetical protein